MNKLETALDICNYALSKLGEKPIPGIDAMGNPAQHLCYMHYHAVRREVLCATKWSFATKKVTLSITSVDPLSNVPFAHRIPADCIRVLECSDSNWTLRGRNIYSYAEKVDLTYIADEEDPTIFEPLFTEAFATRLACRLCIPLTSSTVKRQSIAEEYNHQINN